MRKLNKQDFMFIGVALLYIVITLMIYFIVRLYFVDTCVPPPRDEGYVGYAINIRHTKFCFGAGGLFDRYSLFIYILLLWITIVAFIRKKYLLSNNKLFIVRIVTLMGIVGIVVGTLTVVYNL